MLRSIFASSVTLVIALAGCVDHTPVCVPRTFESCFCGTGDLGRRACAPDGESYGDCECVPAGSDADSDNAGAEAPVVSTPVMSDQ